MHSHSSGLASFGQPRDIEQLYIVLLVLCMENVKVKHELLWTLMLSGKIAFCFMFPLKVEMLSCSTVIISEYLCHLLPLL